MSVHHLGATLLAILLTAGCTASTSGSSTSTPSTEELSPPEATEPSTAVPTSTTEQVLTEAFIGVEIDLGVTDAWRGRAVLMDSGRNGWGRSLWLAAGGGEGGSPGAPEVYRIDPGTFEVIETLNFQGSVSLLDASEDAVWFAKRGDGAEPESFVAWYDMESGVVQETNLGRTFSPNAIAAVADGLWLAHGGSRAEVAFFDPTTNEFATRLPLDGLADLTDIKPPNPEFWGTASSLWVSDFYVGVRQIDAETGATISETSLPGNPIAIGVSSQLLWVVGTDGTLWEINASGQLVAEWPAPHPDRRACCLLANPTSDSVFLFYEDGAGYWVSPSGGPFLAFHAGQEFVAGIAEAGTGFWTTGEVLTRIELGQ